jgi:hypothetical protein
MFRWFPEVDDNEGIEKALKAGFIAELVFAATIALGITVVLVTGRYPGAQGSSDPSFLVGMVVELAVVLVAAWRFKIGKGLVWGAVTLVLFALEIIEKLASGHIGWMLFYAAIAAGLINGMRGAWARRTIPAGANYADVFE